MISVNRIVSILMDGQQSLRFGCIWSIWMALHIGILPGNDEDRGHLHMGIFNLENRLSTFTNDCLLVRSIELAKSDQLQCWHNFRCELRAVCQNTVCLFVSCHIRNVLNPDVSRYMAFFVYRRFVSRAHTVEGKQTISWPWTPTKAVLVTCRPHLFSHSLSPHSLWVVIRFNIFFRNFSLFGVVCVRYYIRIPQRMYATTTKIVRIFVLCAIWATLICISSKFGMQK